MYPGVPVHPGVLRLIFPGICDAFRGSDISWASGDFKFLLDPDVLMTSGALVFQEA